MVYRARAIPNIDAYEFALSRSFVKDNHRRMLAAHWSAPARIVTVGMLAAGGGYPRVSSANLHYGKLGRLVGEFLGIEFARYSKGPLLTTALAEGWEERGPGLAGRGWRWRLYPEVALAIERLGFAS